jgi:hypothetical protein
MIYVHQDLLEALANEIRCEVSEQLVAVSTISHDVSDQPCVLNDVVKAAGAPVPVNCDAFSSCVIRAIDLEKMSLGGLIRVYVYPLALSLARGIDQVLVEQASKKLAASEKVHRLPETTRETCLSILLDARKALNENLSFVSGRHLLVNTTLETNILKTVDDDDFEPGKILGFNVWLDNCVQHGLAWHEKAVTLVSRVPTSDEKLTNSCHSSEQIALRVTITPQKDSPDFILKAETLLGVTISKPEFAVILGDIE